jgi:hypothetical protein
MINPAIATALNGIVLIVMSLWGYLGSDSPSFTALIPAVFGVIFLLLYPGMKKENKVVAHIIVVLTLLLIISLFKPLNGAISRDDTMAMIRVGAMMFFSIIAMISYIQSFIAARKNKA